MAVEHRTPGEPPPVWLTRFVGRRRELEQLERALTGPGRLITLCALGGAGKSRLAAEVARRAERSKVVDLVVWVGLAPVSDASAVLSLVMSGLGLAPTATDPVRELSRLPSGRRVLVVLDNCEHLLDVCADLTDTLRRASTELRVLTTSRVPLGAADEVVYPVPALSTMDGTCSEAVELFLDRARLSAPTYAPSAADRAHLDAVCLRLQGMPLAIELSAPWIRVMSARDLLDQVDRALDTSGSGGHGLEERHRSLQGVLEACWVDLAPEDRRTFAALGVFVGGATLPAAEFVAGATLQVLASLTDRALVQHTNDDAGGTRFGLHELLRIHAAGRLEASAALTDARQRHLHYFLGLAEQAAAAGETPEEPAWLDALDRDRGNLETALRWALDSGRTVQALRLTAALWTYWIYRCRTQDYDGLVQAVLTMPWDEQNPGVARARARVLNLAGWTAIHPVAGTGRTDRTRLAVAGRLFSEATALSHTFGDAEYEGLGLRGGACVAMMGGAPDVAVSMTEQSLELCLGIQSPTSVAWSLLDLAIYVYLAGDIGRAEVLSCDGLERFQALGSVFGIYQGRLLRAELRRSQGRAADAVEQYRMALEAQSTAPIRTQGADILFGVGGLALDAGRLPQAARLFGAGETWRQTFGRSGLFVPRQDADVARVRERLPNLTWVRYHGQGCALSVAAAQSLAGEVVEQLQTLPTSTPGLTDRETEVLRLVAVGLSDTAIAGRLSLSRRTVQAHLRSIFTKLDVTSRTAAAHRASMLELA